MWRNVVAGADDEVCMRWMWRWTDIFPWGGWPSLVETRYLDREVGTQPRWFGLLGFLFCVEFKRNSLISEGSSVSGKFSTF